MAMIYNDESRLNMTAIDMKHIEELRIETARRMNETTIGKLASSGAMLSSVTAGATTRIDPDEWSRQRAYVQQTIDHEQLRRLLDDNRRLFDENKRILHAIEILTDSYMKLEKKFDEREEEHKLLASEVFKLKKEKENG